MKTAFVTKCQFCKKRLEPHEGELVRARGRLIAYCPEHESHGYTDAQNFVRERNTPTPDDDIKTFPDGSKARVFQGNWVASQN